MALVACPAGFYWPIYNELVSSHATAATTTIPIDTTNDRAGFTGHCYIEGRATSKTISSAGGKLYFATTGSNTFANGATTMDVGIQDTSTSSGPPPTPDGSYDVKATLTGGADTIAAWTTATMETGSKTISHGDLISIVITMTNRAGADVVNVICGNYFTIRAAALQNLTGTWAYPTLSSTPFCTIEFDDGTLGWLDGCIPISSYSSTSFTTDSDPDEYGLLFQVPWDCQVDGFWVRYTTVGAASDATITLYSDPLGTPASMASVAIIEEQWNTSSGLPGYVLLASPVTLSRNTNYCVAVKATSTSGVGLLKAILGTEANRKFFPASTTMAGATRNNSTGAFSAESPATNLYQLGVRISALPDQLIAGVAGSRMLLGVGI